MEFIKRYCGVPSIDDINNRLVVGIKPIKNLLNDIFIVHGLAKHGKFVSACFDELHVF